MMLKSFVVFLVCVLLGLLIKTTNGYLYQIIEQIETAIVEDRGTAYLNCTMAIDPSFKTRAMWYTVKNNKQISRGENLMKPIHLGPNDIPKYAVRFIKGRSAYIPKIIGASENVFIYQLIVRYVDIADESRYKCSIEISDLDSSQWPVAWGKVILQRRPQIVPTALPLIVSEGEPIELDCKATGSPTPKISWTRANGYALPLEGSPQRIFNSTLYLPKARRWDRGVYRCYAENNVGKADEYDVMVEVNYKPLVRVARKAGSYAQSQEGMYDVMLECIINGYPDPDLYWYKGIYDPKQTNDVINDGARYETEKMPSYGSAGMNVTDVFFTLLVRNVKPNDFGEYTCRASNKAGESQKTVNVFAQMFCQGPSCFMGTSKDISNDSPGQIAFSTTLFVILSALSIFFVSGLGINQ